MMRRRLRWQGAALLGALWGFGGSAEAMTYRPLSDENLVAASALVVTGEVEEVASARLADGRLVTQTSVWVDEALKGRVASPRVLVTEAGGRLRDIALRIPGMPEFAPGERVLVFLRERSDGTLGTTALSLAKYTLSVGPNAIARRATPEPDVRALASFATRIRTLAGPAAARSVSDGFAGAAAVEVEVHVDGFTLLGNGGDCDPIAFDGCTGSRWFEAVCGLPMTYSVSGVDPDAGEAASRLAVSDALAAWSSAVGGFLQLVVGPDVPTVPSALAPSSSADFDGRNVIQFDDPFEIVPDLIGCQGVLALGGTLSTPGEQVTQGTTTFDRTLEGDVVVNQGVGGCLAPDGLAETVAHEVGHTLGFGHSSEDQGEPDATLRDALMFFLIHDDGRGARLGSDDLTGVAFSYGPPVAEPTPADEAVRDAACSVSFDLWSSGCFLDQERIGPVAVPARKKFVKARKLAAKADRSSKPKRQLKLLKQADAQLAKALGKIDALASAGTLRTECASGLRRGVTTAQASIATARGLLEAAL
jgi:hypothetical protein